ncbi:MAG: NifU family protein [bacterium]
MKEKIIKELDLVRINLQAHGGDVEFVDFDETQGKLQVRLIGACQGCPMATLTLKQGIEKHFKNKFKKIKEVEAV